MDLVVNPKVLNMLQKQAALADQEFSKSSDSGISDVEADGVAVYATIHGPEGTAYHGGKFRVKLAVLGADFPRTPPKAFFHTKIFHPNINQSTGDVCVNALQKDWDPANWSIAHIFKVIRCLMIIPFPESALNPEAAKLFMESYQDFFQHAKMLTNLHAGGNSGKNSSVVLQEKQLHSNNTPSSTDNSNVSNNGTSNGLLGGTRGGASGTNNVAKVSSIAAKKNKSALKRL